MLRHASFGANLPSGDDYLDAIKALSGKARESVTLDYVRERWLPPSMLAFSSWPTAVISGKDALGKPHVLEVQVSPDVLRVGADEATSVVAPMWPTTAQYVADELGLRTIGKKLARAVFESAKVQGNLYLANPGEPFYDMKAGTPRNIEDSRAWAASDKKRRAWLDQKVSISDRKKTLVAGYAKDVVHQASAGNKVSGKQLAIYGGGGGKVDGWAIQTFPGPHTWNYGPDYSHGIRLARKKAYLDGVKVDLDAVAKDPILHTLLSDAGPYNNRMSFPSPELSLGGDVDADDYVPSDKPKDDDAEPPRPPASSFQEEDPSVVPYLLGGLGLYATLRWMARSR